MEITNKQIKRFVEIYQKEFGILLSEKEAIKESQKVLSLFVLLSEDY
jgi:hypothetical protein